MREQKSQSRVAGRFSRALKIKAALARLRANQEICRLKQIVAENEARSKELEQSSQTILARLNRSLNAEMLAKSVGHKSALVLIGNEASFRSVCRNEHTLAQKTLARQKEKLCELESEIKFLSDDSRRQKKQEKACLKLELKQHALKLAVMDSREQIDVDEICAQRISIGRLSIGQISIPRISIEGISNRGRSVGRMSVGGEQWAI